MKNIQNIINHDQLFNYAESLGFGDIHFKTDQETGLKAIIAVHNTVKGPAIGGCRCISYDSTYDALRDALRLAYMMSYKAAICNLPHGGAKAVLIHPGYIKDRPAYFHAFGNFINELNGKYITAADSGTSITEMDMIAQATPYVTCGSDSGGDPSPYTALGVMRAIEAAVRFKLGKSDLEGVRIAIQGAGYVGYNLAQQLTLRNAIVTQSDINPTRLQRCIDEFNVIPVASESIYDIPCDVFAPCALGAILNTTTIPRLKATIVAGSANNQLAHKQDGILLHNKGILYAPDFVTNAGGLIYLSAVYNSDKLETAHKQIVELYDVLWDIFDRSQTEDIATSEIAETLAQKRMKP